MEVKESSKGAGLIKRDDGKGWKIKIRCPDESLTKQNEFPPWAGIMNFMCSELFLYPTEPKQLNIPCPRHYIGTFMQSGDKSIYRETAVAPPRVLE